ncbi:hypothetical protein SHVI106290_05305 [Shewanella violacea]
MYGQVGAVVMGRAAQGATFMMISAATGVVVHKTGVVLSWVAIS